MAAITAAVNRQAKGTPKTRRVLMTNSITIPKGALVGILASTGLAVNAVAGATVAFIAGIAAETKTSGTGGADWIQVEYDREYLFTFSASAAQTDVGKPALVI